MTIIRKTVEELIAKCKEMVEAEGEHVDREDYVNEADPSILRFLLASRDEVFHYFFYCYAIYSTMKLALAVHIICLFHWALPKLFILLFYQLKFWRSWSVLIVSLVNFDLSTNLLLSGAATELCNWKFCLILICFVSFYFMLMLWSSREKMGQYLKLIY